MIAFNERGEKVRSGGLPRLNGEAKGRAADRAAGLIDRATALKKQGDLLGTIRAQDDVISCLIQALKEASP